MARTRVLTRVGGPTGRTGYKKANARPASAGKVSRLRRPEEMSCEQWQIALRRQFAQRQDYRVTNLGTEAIFSELLVANPVTGGEYRVAIRGHGLGDNCCSCPDFAVNTLGTCKHIEWLLGKPRFRRGAIKALGDGFRPAYSEVYLRYGAKREVVFRAGTECPKGLRELAAGYFDAHGALEDRGYRRFDVFLRQAAAFSHDLRCYDDMLDFIAEVRDRATLAECLDKAFPAGIESSAFKDLLKVPLYPHQREGALFAAIGRTLAPILIRRTKKQVLRQLPERLDKNYIVPMTKEQMAHHEENREIAARIAAKWRRFGFLSEADQRRLMIALQNMRMSCNSTYLLDRKTDFGCKADELVSVLQESVDRVTGSIPPAMPAPEDGGAPTSDAAGVEESTGARSAGGRPWGDLLSAGLSFLGKRSSALSAESSRSVDGGAGLRVETDITTGRRHLTLPGPSKRVRSDIAGLLSQLAEKL